MWSPIEFECELTCDLTEERGDFLISWSTGVKARVVASSRRVIRAERV